MTKHNYNDALLVTSNDWIHIGIYMTIMITCTLFILHMSLRKKSIIGEGAKLSGNNKAEIISRLFMLSIVSGISYFVLFNGFIDIKEIHNNKNHATTVSGIVTGKENGGGRYINMPSIIIDGVPYIDITGYDIKKGSSVVIKVMKYSELAYGVVVFK